jgi:hypothetical protein
LLIFFDFFWFGELLWFAVFTLRSACKGPQTSTRRSNLTPSGSRFAQSKRSGCAREFFRLGRPKGRDYGFDLCEGGGVGGSMLGRDNGDGDDD